MCCKENLFFERICFMRQTDWTKYAKWLMPLLGCQVILSFASLTILQSIGWTGL